MSNVAPDISQALSHAIEECKAGHFGEAERLCAEVIAAQPDCFRAYVLLAEVQSSNGRIGAALATYDILLSRWPGYAAGHASRGYALYKLGRHEEAVESYDRAVAIRPQFALAYSNRGMALHELRRYRESLASYDRAILLSPAFAVAHYNRGLLLYDMRRYEEAAASYERAIQVRSDFAEAHSNRGNTLQKLKRFDEAVLSYDRAVALSPSYGDAFLNRGAALAELRRYDDALASYERALNINPNHADAHFNAALLRLLKGDLADGWEEYEWRWDTRQMLQAKRHFVQPRWRGKGDIAGKTMLLYGEQGFGDTIQFSRYVPLVAKRGARVVLQVQDALTELMASLVGTSEVLALGSQVPDFQLQCPVGSLPLAFETTIETIPPPALLQPSQNALLHWEMRLGPKLRPRIGLVWSGRPTHLNDANRSIALASLLPLLDLEATFVSLQKDVGIEDSAALRQRRDLVHFGEELKNFSDTAALISHLDLVVSVDTSVAHLAGAIGKPVWILLPHTPDFRWLLDRTDSPWYPTARLFRQDCKRTWQEVIARVRTELVGFVEKMRQAN